MRYSSAIFLIVIFLASGCLDPYNPSGDTQNYNYLVVDGFVNSVDGSGTVKLTRTKPLNDADPVVKVTNAQVTLEDESGSNFSFIEIEEGMYSLSGAIITPTKKYKLNITTDTNSTYQSDLVPVMDTPDIDSVTWKQLNNKIDIYTNTHNANDNTRYYRWKYIETWHYNSAFKSTVLFDGTNVVLRDNNDDIYNCYSSYNSSDIIIHSTNKLQDNVVKEFVVTSFSISTLKIKTKYSIEIEQQALTKQAYEYWELLKKTTENLGSLFDPQPSQVTGNIHCTSNPQEPTIGIFSIGTITKKRIFIQSNEIKYTQGTRPFDERYAGCNQDTLLVEDIPTFFGGQLLTYPTYKGIMLIGYLKSAPSCVDCRLGGGSNVKPDFWE
jgi:hypothetical protein